MTDQARRVFVLGHRGMLGHVVARYMADQGCDVVTSLARYDGAPRNALIEEVRDSGVEVVINCLGLTKQRSDDRAALVLANALFPMHLMMRLRPTQYLIHASTDCVFAGTRGAYRIDETCDATDDYGFSKVLGEGVARWPNATVLRVSVVGPEGLAGPGVLAWFLRQPTSQPVPGYVNHRWNGITSLEWATLSLALAETRWRGGPTPSCVQPGTPVITKHDLLCAFRDVFAPHLCVVPVTTPIAVDRSLVPTEARPPIRDQLEQLATWYPLDRSAAAGR
jgi:dTDP-4-dehydrorhamnose reductase